MPRISRFKRRLDDRTGFKHWEIDLVKDGPWKVDGIEWDVPPPSKRSLGGEGDTSAVSLRSNSDATGASVIASSGTQLVVTYVDTTTTLSPLLVQSWMPVSGSLAAITLAQTPQIAAGQVRQVLTLQCVDSAITISDGSGVNLMGTTVIQLNSGSIITFTYDTGGSVWQETSRSLTPQWP